MVKASNSDLLVKFTFIRDLSPVKLGQKDEMMFDQSQPQIQPSMAHMAQIILSKPLFIIVWMYQEMLRWLSRLLNGAVVVIG
jgi:hypothetical protein